MLKLYKSMVVAFLSLWIFSQSYPQSLLINVDNLQNCEKNIVDKSIKEQSEYLKLDMSYPQVKGIPQEKSINLSIDKTINDIVREVKDVVKQYYGHGEPKPLTPYELYSRYKVTNNEKILSFYFDIYQFTGGAHGITTRYSYNIDIGTGEIKTIDTLFKDKNYKDIIDKEIQRQINLNKDEYFQGNEGFKGVNKDTRYYIDKDNIVIYYQQYEIAPYVKGIPEFIIPLKLIS